MRTDWRSSPRATASSSAPSGGAVARPGADGARAVGEEQGEPDVGRRRAHCGGDLGEHARVDAALRGGGGALQQVGVERGSMFARTMKNAATDTRITATTRGHGGREHPDAGAQRDPVEELEAGGAAVGRLRGMRWVAITGGVSRSTYPTPRTVWISRGSPSASVLRRR